MKSTPTKKGLRFAALSLPLLCATGINSSAQAAITFTFNYSDTAGTGFNDASLGSTRQNALQSAANTLGSFFTNSATLNFDVSSTNVNNGTLASAGSPTYYPTPGSGSFNMTVAQNKVINNIDDNGSDADGQANFNFFHTWDYDDSIASNAYDFKTTAMHEMLHALGFASAISPAGQGYDDQTSGDPDAWAIYDQFVVDGSGNRLVNAAGQFQTGELGDITGGTEANGVFFNGANAVAANGGAAVNLYSPAPYDEGSSTSHLDTDFFKDIDLIMEHAADLGPGPRDLSAIERGIMMDLGYTVTAVPVPPAVILFGSALAGLFGFRVRGRKSAEAAA